jgi:excisionase family DNA binding protein
LAQVISKKFLSTGQAAELCSVTPDTVLKWIKSGRIKAHRTPGGHYRVHRDTLQGWLDTSGPQHVEEEEARHYQYCWEFYSKSGCLPESCSKCLVFRSRAGRCYEIGKLTDESDHAKLLCRGSCEECEYYRVVQGQRPNVLVVTDQQELQSSLKKEPTPIDYNLRVSDCEYHCSMVVEKFRPDYVVIDCALGVERSRDFVTSLEQDPRIPFVKVILASESKEIPEECDKSVFAFMRRPFGSRELSELIRGANRENPAA